ncbi:MAG TPA: Gfo/Idh/MocA family oxidoreductase [Dehalococcoidia bacterium]
MPSERPNVAVIGVGNIGRHHARIYRDLDGVHLVAVADADEARARSVAREFGCRPYADYRELLARERLDAVSVAVPTSHHLQVARDVIHRGVPLLIEKPIAATPEEGRVIVEEAARQGVPVAVGHVERFNPAVRALKDLVARGTLGRVLSVAVRRVGVVPPRLNHTNVIIDLAVHDIDVVTYLLDRPPELRGVMSGRAWTTEHNDWADLTLCYGDISCFIQVNWVTPIKIRTLALTGTDGYAELNYVTQSLDLYESSPLREADNFQDFVNHYGTPRKREVHVQQDEPLRLELQSFLDSVLRGTPVEVPGEAGLTALTVAYQAWQASLESAGWDPAPLPG